MINPLTAKLSGFTELSAQDREQLDRLLAFRTRIKAPRDLIVEGDRPDRVVLLLSGWACRYKMLENGHRAIVAYLLPGDLCDPHVFILDRMDHSIGLLNDAEVALIPKEVILDLTARSATIARALWWSALVDEAVLRHWLVNLGQRDAYERLAHLFCELWARADRVGLVRRDAFDLPLTQEQLGDTVGLTPVHVNRVLQRMRRDGLIELTNRRLTVLDMGRMRNIAGFSSGYLHMDRRQ